MPRFTYDYGGEPSPSKENTHAGMQTYTQLRTITHPVPHAHVCLSSSPRCYNEMEDRLCQCRDGVTLWLCPAGFDPVTSSSQPPLSLCHSQEQRGGSSLSWRVELETVCCFGLHSLQQALSHAQPRHLNMAKHWHMQKAQHCGCLSVGVSCVTSNKGLLLYPLISQTCLKKLK